jgi:LuxR family maltose regulon positive regulatory protein
LYRSKTSREPADLKSGIRLADHMIGGALQHRFVPFALEALLVRAQLHAGLGDDRASRADYRLALELGQSEGYISIFVEEGPPIAAALKNLLEQNQLGTVQPDYVRQILAAFPGPGPSTATPSRLPPEFEPLTERELDVLRLMAEGMKYEEIAERLYISLNTVRSHVKAVYGKFGVDNRTKAIEAARQMRIL